MSGGSYDYLYGASDLEELLGRRNSLREMAERLNGMVDAEDVFGETEELILMIKAVERRVAVRLKRLAPVWKAVEWYDSSDWGVDQLKQAITEYREGSK